MVLPILAMIVIFVILWVVLWLFFPSIKGLLKLVIAVALGLLVMKGLSSWFGLFDGFFVGNWLWRVVGILTTLAVVYFLFMLTGTARRMFLFVLALVGGFYLATLAARLFGIDGVVSTPKNDTDDIVVVDT
ncbi:MAG: hypothetical protein H6766_02370 [Candidatus Peribacteria bacterium]|nr:MAG: hypothetical protein H6766_02370 [Candidatus Peribacteria bacterium]